MLNVQVKLTGTTEAGIRFKARSLSLHDFKIPLAAIGKSLVDYYSGPVFTSQGGELGLKWPTLAAKTMAEKAKHYPQYATTPLIRTGTMKKSFKFLATPVSVTIRNDAPYFKYHQSSAPRTKIPYRPMMAINEPVKLIIKTILEADIRTKMEVA